MNHNHPPLLQEYVRLQREAEEKWGAKTILFMMVGSFYEVYEVLMDVSTGRTCGLATEMSRLCNIILTKKNKALEFCGNNPYMCGFPTYCKVRYVDRLTSCGYSVVLSDQDPGSSVPGAMMVRKITTICSPMVPASLVMSAEDEDAQFFSSSNVQHEDAQDHPIDRVGFSVMMENVDPSSLIVSVVIINLTTGLVGVHETLWSSVDFLELLFMKYSPVEVRWLRGTKTTRDHFRERYPDIKHHESDTINTMWGQLSYQEKVLTKTFFPEETVTDNDTVQIHHHHRETVQERLELERFPLTTMNLVSFLDFVYEHFPMVIRRLMPPRWETLNEGVDYLPHVFQEIHLLSGKPSVFEIMDHTSTKMGRRNYRMQWFHPLSSVDTLHARYDVQETLIRCPQKVAAMNKGRSILAGLHDWESTLRSFSMDRYSLRRILCLWRDLDALPSIAGSEIQRRASYLSESLNRVFCRQHVEEHNWCFSMLASSSSSSTFEKEQPQDQEWIREVAELLGIASYTNLSAVLKIHETGTEGICVQFKPSKNLKMEITEVMEKLSSSHYTTRKMSGGMIRIQHPLWTAWWEKKKEEDHDLERLHREEFRITAASWVKEHLSALRELCTSIVDVDILWSKTTAAIKLNLSRPRISSLPEPTNVRGLRNPIVESVNPLGKFVVNDFVLEKGEGGILLFGENSAGKSTYVKSIGMNVWLAQTGHFVFCEEMCFRPYSSILTKLCVQDDIFHGQSTFVNEMMDLRYIIRRCRDFSNKLSQKRILVLADELTAGTETWSATSIVASTLMELLNTMPNIDFVMTTHLHTLHLFRDLYHDARLSIRHIHFATTSSTFRKILPGEGPVMYGIEVAENLGFPPDFIARCFHYREAMNTHLERAMPLPVLHHESESKKNSGRRPTLVAVKKSRYNKNKIMDCCENCGTKVDLETHHIVPQAEAVVHPVSGKPVLQSAEGAAGISLHTGSNLRILCRTCHDNEHLTF